MDHVASDSRRRLRHFPGYTVFKLLTSPDSNTREFAVDDCARVAAARMNQHQSIKLISHFMIDEELPRRSSDSQLIWTKARSGLESNGSYKNIS